MKKKSAVFFALLFAGTLAFSFGIASADVRPDPTPIPCCDIPATSGCSAGKGHWELVPHQPAICVYTGRDLCEIAPVCW